MKTQLVNILLRSPVIRTNIFDVHFFKKIWANPGLFFVYFRPFHITNQLQIEKA